MTRHLLALIPAAVGLLLALLLGGSPFWIALAGVLYVASLGAQPRLAVVLLLAAPILAGLSGSIASVVDARILGWALVALLTVTPLFLRLGGALPWRATLVVWVIAPALVAAASLFTWAPSVFTSDLAGRAQVLMLAGAALIVVSLLEAIDERSAG